jgi:hypothetical protein
MPRRRQKKYFSSRFGAQHDRSLPQATALLKPNVQVDVCGWEHLPLTPRLRPWLYGPGSASRLRWGTF